MNDAPHQPSLFAPPPVERPAARTGDESVRPLDHLHTTKRGRNERGGVHAWHSYYAGYSERFVDEVLHELAAPGAVVLDPWNGSGTTTYVAQRRGLRSYGIEINPVMVAHARAKDLRFVPEADAVLSAARDVAVLAAGGVHEVGDGFSEFVAPATWTTLRALVRAARMVATAATGGFSRPASAPVADGPDYEAFFLSAAFQTLRLSGSFQKGSNPMWLRAGVDPTEVERVEVLRLFVETAERMVGDLRAAAGTGDIANLTVARGDSRALPLDRASVDVVVTSPPYCTRIDYVVPTRPELQLLGTGEQDYDYLRRETMGAPVVLVKGKDSHGVPEWGPTCNEFVRSVAHHESKASESYYLPTFFQYFQDTQASLVELHRVLRDGGAAALVVQSSYYKDVELPLGEVYVEMACAAGFDAEIGKREVVRQHMAHVNTNSTRYASGKVYHEDVVVLHKAGARPIPVMDPEYSSHRDHLEQARVALGDRPKDLESAIEAAFSGVMERREVSFIRFDHVSAEDLAVAFERFPKIVKPVLALVNVASRAVKRDLGLTIDLYRCRPDGRTAALLAGYIKPLLPWEAAVPSLLRLDEYLWVDTEMRKQKGAWERRVRQFLSGVSGRKFEKRKFSTAGEKYELDVAYPATGLPIEIGVDVKRTESPLDIHKRSDEILKKADAFKAEFPEGRFYAVVYYPFPSGHQNVRSRLQSANIDGVFFASERDLAIEEAATALLADAGALPAEPGIDANLFESAAGPESETFDDDFEPYTD